MQTLIAFSHLRWDFVYQRPQHLLSRLAKHYRVLFFEEPVRGKQTPFLLRFEPCSNVEVLRPHTTIDAPGFHDDQFSELEPLLAEYLSDFSITDYLVWFCSPMALPLLAELTPRAVIYDCMDERPPFQDAPRQMVQREMALMRRAQLVLAAGPSLYEAKRRLHSNVHCLPSAVDADHFTPHAAVSNVRQRSWDDIARVVRAEIEALPQEQTAAAASSVPVVERAFRPVSTRTGERLRVRAVDRGHAEAAMPASSAG